MNGIVNIYKERGYTSHDVVARLRGITGQRRMGHTGTLDPDAEGVLPVCLGTATKACEVLTDKSKCYEAVMLLGMATDSQDTTGNVTALAPEGMIQSLTDDEIVNAIMSFIGEYDQLPPMFSAVRKDGQRLYEMARAGKEIERETRHVEINSIELTSGVARGTLGDVFTAKELKENSLIAGFIDRTRQEQGRFERYTGSVHENTPDETPVVRIAFRVECSKGTFIRTLCNDIGEKIGCFGCMERLVRTRVSQFTIDEAITLKDAEDFMKDGTFESHLLDTDRCFMQYTRLDTKEKYDDLLLNGNQLWFRHFSQYITEPPTPVRVYSSKGEFIGLYEYMEGRNKYTPLKVFIESE